MRRHQRYKYMGVLVLAAIIDLGSVTAVAEWSVSGTIAESPLESGRMQVVFAVDDSCDLAALIVEGAGFEGPAVLVVDQSPQSLLFERGATNVWSNVGPSVFDALATGSSGWLIMNSGTRQETVWRLDLTGSARAINSAFNACTRLPP